MGIVFPSRRLTIDSGLPLAEVVDSLRGLTRDPIPAFSAPLADGGHRFQGTVTERGFRLLPILRGRRSSFVPEVVGTIAETATGTRLVLEMRLAPAVRVFGVVWLGMATLFVGLAVLLVSRGVPIVIVLFFLMFPVMFQAMMRTSFAHEAAAAERILRDLAPLPGDRQGQLAYPEAVPAPAPAVEPAPAWADATQLAAPFFLLAWTTSLTPEQIGARFAQFATPGDIRLFPRQAFAERPLYGRWDQAGFQIGWVRRLINGRRQPAPIVARGTYRPGPDGTRVEVVVTLPLLGLVIQMFVLFVWSLPGIGGVAMAVLDPSKNGLCVGGVLIPLAGTTLALGQFGWHARRLERWLLTIAPRSA